MLFTLFGTHFPLSAIPAADGEPLPVLFLAPTHQRPDHLLSQRPDSRRRRPVSAQRSSPCGPEFITPQDGHTKQDCGIAAAKRWLYTYRWARRVPLAEKGTRPSTSTGVNWPLRVSPRYDARPGATGLEAQYGAYDPSAGRPPWTTRAWPAVGAVATNRVVYDASAVKNPQASSDMENGPSRHRLTMQAWLFGHAIRWERGQSTKTLRCQSGRSHDAKDV